PGAPCTCPTSSVPTWPEAPARWCSVPTPAPGSSTRAGTSTPPRRRRPTAKSARAGAMSTTGASRHAPPGLSIASRRRRPADPRRKPMTFYIDSADRELIEELWPTGIFRGVTTNPTILSRSGLGQDDLPALYTWLTDLGVDTFYAQVLGTTADAMLTSAATLLGLGPVVVKVPATAAGFQVARKLVADGVRVLLTAVYHPVQAVAARDLGIQGVAPYVGRMTDAGRDGLGAVALMQQAIGSEPTRILAASLRS